jgi:ankyrin repeat protein
MGVDYYNCSKCNEIYADCGPGGYCDYGCDSGSRRCFNCHFDYTTAFDLPGEEPFVLCNDHLDRYKRDSDSESEESESESESESEKEPVINALIEYINEKYQKYGVNITSMKHLYSFKHIPKCSKCSVVNCKSFKRIGYEYYKYHCCVCKDKNYYDKTKTICKSCKKGPLSESPYVKEREFAELCSKEPTEKNINRLKEIIEKKPSNYIEAFNISCINGRLDFIKLILEHFSDNFTNEHKCTGLYFAVENYHVDVTEYLINVCDYKMNKLILYMFKKSKKADKIFDIIESKITDQNDLNYCLFLACRFSNISIVKKCIIHLKETQTQDILNEALLFSCSSFNNELVEFFIDQGANNFNECLLYLCSHTKDDIQKYESPKINMNLVNRFIELGANNFNECLMFCKKEVRSFLISKGGTYKNFSMNKYYDDTWDFPEQ